MYRNILSSIIHNSQKVETTQMPISESLGKQNMLFPYSGLLLNHKKEWSMDPCYSVVEPQKHRPE